MKDSFVLVLFVRVCCVSATFFIRQGSGDGRKMFLKGIQHFFIDAITDSGALDGAFNETTIFKFF
jgi:hypothetical protein